MNILIVGEERTGDLMPMYREAFRNMGHSVTCYDQLKDTTRLNKWLVGRAINKISGLPTGLLVTRCFRRFIGSIPKGSIDLTFILQPMYFAPKLLTEIKAHTGGLLVTWQTGDYRSPTMSSRWGVKGIPLYDCVFAHGAFDVPFAREAGASRAEYLPLGCNPCYLHPIGGAERVEPTTDVVFVGHWRPERQRLFEELVRNGFPHRLRIWGYGWNERRVPRSSALGRHLEYRGADWEQIGPVFRSSRIVLALLTYFDTGRVVAPLRLFEIAASGAFMLVERGQGQAAEFFREGEEIACFDGVDDLRKTIDVLLPKESERRAMALAAQQRVLRDGYLCGPRLEEMLEVCAELREGRTECQVRA